MGCCGGAWDHAPPGSQLLTAKSRRGVVAPTGDFACPQSSSSFSSSVSRTFSCSCFFFGILQLVQLLFDRFKLLLERLLLSFEGFAMRLEALWIAAEGSLPVNVPLMLPLMALARGASRLSGGAVKVPLHASHVLGHLSFIKIEVGI